MSSQGLMVTASAHNLTDYYGRPEYREVLMRFDFQQSGQIMEPRWSNKYPGRRPLGISPSGKFAIYLMSWVPASMNRQRLALELWHHVPPTDEFRLSFDSRYQWQRERIEIPMELKELTFEMIAREDVA